MIDRTRRSRARAEPVEPPWCGAGRGCEDWRGRLALATPAEVACGRRRSRPSASARVPPVRETKNGAPAPGSACRSRTCRYSVSACTTLACIGRQRDLWNLVCRTVIVAPSQIDIADRKLQGLGDPEPDRGDAVRIACGTSAGAGRPRGVEAPGMLAAAAGSPRRCRCAASAFGARGRGFPLAAPRCPPRTDGSRPRRVARSRACEPR